MDNLRAVETNAYRTVTGGSTSLGPLFSALHIHTINIASQQVLTGKHEQQSRDQTTLRFAYRAPIQPLRSDECYKDALGRPQTNPESQCTGVDYTVSVGNELSILKKKKSSIRATKRSVNHSHHEHKYRPEAHVMALQIIDQFLPRPSSTCTNA